MSLENTIFLLKNFITSNERDELVEWIIKNKDNEFFNFTPHPGCIRRTTRSSLNVPYPTLSFIIRKRIEDKLNLKAGLYPNFPSGMVATYGFEDDECSFHTDPVWLKDHITFHCVLLLSAGEEGGVPVIDDKEYEMNELDGLFYPVSHLVHGTTKLVGNKPRILWIFGFLIHKDFKF